MITRKRDHGTGLSEWYGKSTDVKPTEPYPAGPYNSDVFYEMDTKKVYMYDADGKVWLEQ